MKAIPKDVFVSTAQELGLWKGGILVGDGADTDILADRMIYDRRWDGGGCVEHFEAKNAGMELSASEGRFLAAMKTACFSLFTVRETHPGSYSVLSDRLAEIRSGHHEVSSGEGIWLPQKAPRPVRELQPLLLSVAQTVRHRRPVRGRR